MINSLSWEQNKEKCLSISDVRSLHALLWRCVQSQWRRLITFHPKQTISPKRELQAAWFILVGSRLTLNASDELITHLACYKVKPVEEKQTDMTYTSLFTDLMGYLCLSPSKHWLMFLGCLAIFVYHFIINLQPSLRVLSESFSCFNLMVSNKQFTKSLEEKDCMKS